MSLTRFPRITPPGGGLDVEAVADIVDDVPLQPEPLRVPEVNARTLLARGRRPGIPTISMSSTTVPLGFAQVDPEQSIPDPTPRIVVSGADHVNARRIAAEVPAALTIDDETLDGHPRGAHPNHAAVTRTDEEDLAFRPQGDGAIEEEIASVRAGADTIEDGARGRAVHQVLQRRAIGEGRTAFDLARRDRAIVCAKAEGPSRARAASRSPSPRSA